LALFRLVNGNVLRTIWFSAVAGKPHMRITTFLRGPSNFNKLAAPTPLTIYATNPGLPGA
jgi:hypothetical protein